MVRQRPLALARGHHYQLRFSAHATKPTRLRVRLSKIDAPYTELWAATAEAAPDARAYAATFDGSVDEENAELAIDLGGALAGAVPLTVCLDDVELNDPQAELPIERLNPRAIPKVRVNQVGYLPGLPKVATVVTAGGRACSIGSWSTPTGACAPAARRARSATITPRASGSNRSISPRSPRPARAGSCGWAARRASRSPSAPTSTGGLKYDALAFFYLQRSGIPIKMPYAGSPAFERAAGHLGDKSVGCAPESPCGYSLDASGGWYDAGDHGKYVVNGGFSVWLLQNEYETLSRFGSTAAAFGDGKMKIPESKNGRPDLLDEARWGLDLFLRLQVPAGSRWPGWSTRRFTARSGRTSRPRPRTTTSSATCARSAPRPP